MWILLPVSIFMLHMFAISATGLNVEKPSTNQNNTVCDVLNPLMYGIIIFLGVLVLILLMLIYKIYISTQNRVRRDSIHITSDAGESTTLHQNNALSVSPSSCDGADNSSSTSSGTPEGSLEDLSSRSQRYVSLQDRPKTSDYINVSETAACGLLDFKDKKTDIDYVNVKESRQKKVNRRGRARCDDGTSISSGASNESTVNYTTVVFT